MHRAVGLAAAGMMLCATVPAATAQTAYPSQPIRFVVTTAPGGGLDSFSRLFARDLTSRAGQQVIVDNRPGAGTTIGSAAVARAKPDGYTVLLNTSAFAISPAIYQKLPYDALRDFIPITLAVSAPNLMVVHPSVPVKSVKDMIALAKTRANQGDPILYASGGNGTNGHLAAALFVSMAQIRMTHVPYRSGSLAVVDLIAGQVPVMIDTMASVMPHVAAGKLRALGVSSTRRAAAAPDIPTIAEAGVPGYESGQWYGLWAPAGTPPDIVAWLHKESVAILRSPSMKERLAPEGLEVVASSPDEFTARIKADISKWTKLVKAIGMSLM
ncbi:MAG: Bug family tripartite tricarboxylate transporter substrate binding protein [Burkholderiales bacterium]